MNKVNEEKVHPYGKWLSLKRSELMKMGYGKITENDLWEYLVTYRWKKERPARYSKIVRDIMHISVNDYFTYETLKAQIYEVSSLDQLDLDGLL